jgi:hypothetical protein
MDRRIPNEDERKKLQKMALSQQQFPIYAFGLTSVFGMVIALFNPYPIVSSALTVATLIAMIYLLLNCALFKKCPRCSSRGTVPHGNCPHCGLHLDPSYKK